MSPKTRVLAAAVVLAAGAAIGAALATSGRRQPPPAAQRPAGSTAVVEQRTLSATVSDPGTLTYRARSDGSPYSVINEAHGTYTQLPAVGQVIPPGHVLYRVSDRPVVLLRGSTPAYRSLSAGASGPDVAELNADLVALGYVTRARLSRTSATFGTATGTAVRKLQAALGMTRTGTLALGQAVFEPTPLRVTSVPGQLGGAGRRGQTVLQGTSTARQVRVALSAAQQTEVAVGDHVTITLPDDRTTTGVVSSVGTVAACAANPGSGGSGSSSSSPGTGVCPSGGSGSDTPTIAVTVAPADPGATGTWDQAPVQVGVTTATVPDALVVPVSALLARAGGGYTVEVVGAGERNHLTAVSLGMFDDADGLVQVTGAGLAAGERVVVPST